MRRALEQAERLRRIFEKVKLAALVILPIAAIAIIYSKTKAPSELSSAGRLLSKSEGLVSTHSNTTSTGPF